MRKVLVLAVAVALAAVAWWQVSQLRSDTKDAAGVTAAGVTEYPGAAGIVLPEVAGRTIDDEPLDLADLRGEVLVVNVWGSWCAPCRAEQPELAAVAQETVTRGVRFVGIDVRDNPAAARAFARRYGVRYPSLDDQNGLLLAQFTGIIPVSAVPSTIVVDANGTIRARIVGKVDASTLRSLIETAEAA